MHACTSGGSMGGGTEFHLLCSEYGHALLDGYSQRSTVRACTIICSMQETLQSMHHMHRV